MGRDLSQNWFALKSANRIVKRDTPENQVLWLLGKIYSCSALTNNNGLANTVYMDTNILYFQQVQGQNTERPLNVELNPFHNMHTGLTMPCPSKVQYSGK